MTKRTLIKGIVNGIFKNVIAYKIQSDFNLPTNFKDLIEQFKFKHCDSTQMTSMGWGEIFNVNGESQYVVEESYFLFIQAKKEEKIIPSSVVKEILKEKIEEMENRLNKKLSKTEKNALKDDIMNELMQKSFHKSSSTSIIINKERNEIYVDASSNNKSEDVLALLRKTLGSLPMSPISMKDFTLNDLFLKDDLLKRKGLNLSNSFEVKDEQGGTIKLNKIEKSDVDLEERIEGNDFTVTKLGLSFDNDEVYFSINENFNLSKLSIGDGDIVKIDDKNEDQDVYSDFVANLITINSVINKIIDKLGG